eukprot:Gb_17424 [translate_table: standard]
MPRQLIPEDSMRPRRKLDMDPPQKVMDFIETVVNTPLEDIESPLSRFIWDYDKGNFHDWTDLFVHFNLFFSKHIGSTTDLQLSSNFLDWEDSFAKGAILQILRVLRLIFENCRNNCSFSCLEHFTHLLSSRDPDILLASLQALAALVNINPAKLHCSGKLPGSAVLNHHLLALSQGWGSKEEGLGLFSCVVENGCDDVACDLGSTLHFEFYSDGTLGTRENMKVRNVSGLQVIHIPDLHLQLENGLVLLQQLVDKYQVPTDLQWILWTRIRYACAFSSLTTRRQYSCIRLLAFMVLVQSSDTHEQLGAFFLNDPEFMNELIKVVQSEDFIPENVRALSMWALGYQFAAVSASHERTRALNVSNVVSSAGNRVLLLSILQKVVMSLMSPEACSLSLVESVLYVFLAYVTSSTTSPSPIRDTGLIPALLPLLHDTDPSHMHLVIFAIKILQKFMNYSNPAVTLFRDLGGLGGAIKRLQFEVGRIVDVSQENKIAGQIPYCQRRLIKALLKVLGSTMHAPANSARSQGSEESALPFSLSLIFRHCHKFGGDIFSSGVTLMNELIHKDPTCFSTLHAAGLPTFFLDAITEGLMPSSKALCCIPSGLDALCLNNIGLQAVNDRNALKFLVEVFTSRKYLLSLNEGVAPMATAMEELMRHVPSLRGPAVDVLIIILEKIASVRDTELAHKESMDGPVPMETDIEYKHNGQDRATGVAVENMSYERFVQLCISHAMVFVHRVMENPDTCRLFVEKRGIEALMKFLILPSIPLSSEGMSVVVHMVSVFKTFTQHHSAALARVFCASLRDHLRVTFNDLNPVAGSNLLATEDGLNRRVFWCFLVIQLFVFLADATRENRWLTALMAEFGNDSKDVLLDMGVIHREILWQVALFEDSQAGTRKDDGTGCSRAIRDSVVHAREVDGNMPPSFGQYVDLILSQHLQSSAWNVEPQLSDLIHLFHDSGHHARLQRRLNMDPSSHGRLARHIRSTHSDYGTSGSSIESSKQKSLHSFCYEILRSLSFHISHLFLELGKVMLLPSRRRDDSPTVNAASRSVASTFACILLDDLNFDGHINGPDMELSASTKCRYLGKVVDFIETIIVDRQDVCNSVLLNRLYAHGVIKSILTTFEATCQLLWTVVQTPVSRETEWPKLKQLEHNDESDNSWIFHTLISYAGFMDHLVTPACILVPPRAHLLVQPAVEGTVSFSKPEKFAKALQSQVLKVVRPVWTHPFFSNCNEEFITSICSIMMHVYSGVDVKVAKATGGVSDVPFRALGPPPDESVIAMIVEMGFSRSRAEEALRRVGSNRVEMAMDWLFSHPEEALQEDDELARALALSLGSTDGSAKEDMVTNGKDIDQEEEMVQALSVDEVLSTCMRLLDTKESLAFSLRDLLVTLCTRNDGQDRVKVISFLIEQLKLWNVNLGSDSNILSLLSHVLALILHEDKAACEVAAHNGLVGILLDILSGFCPHQGQGDNLPVPKWVAAILLALDHMLQFKPTIGSDILSSAHSKKNSVDAQDSESLMEENQQNCGECVLSVHDGYMTTDEQKRAIDIVCNFLQMQLPSTTVQAVLQICARLTRVHSLAMRFLETGGLVSLLSLPINCLFSGFDSVAATIIHHLLEDPQTLRLAMESEIRHNLVAASTQNISGRVSPRIFLTSLAPVISRDPAVFMLASQAVCQIEMVGERPFVILLKDRDKEKGKEKEKAVEKDRLETGDNKFVQGEKNMVGNSGNGSIKFSDVTGKTLRGHKKPPQSFSSIIEQLLDVIIDFSPPAEVDDIGGKVVGSGLVTDMEVDELPLEDKGKAVVRKGNMDLDSRDLAVLAKSVFVLKLLSEILLMYPSAVNVVIRRDTESSHFRGSPQGGASMVGQSGLLHHVLHRLLPFPGTHAKERQADSNWRQKLSNKASQFLMATCVRSAEGRRRLFIEIVNSLNASVSASNSEHYKPPQCQMLAFIDLINDVLSARSPSGSNISAEVSATLIDVGVVQALSCTLQILDLDHPDSVKVANGIVKALESLTMEQVQTHEAARHKSEAPGTSGCDRHQPQNDTDNHRAQLSGITAQPHQNEIECAQMESSQDAQASSQTVGNLMTEHGEDFMHVGIEEDGTITEMTFGTHNGVHDSLSDEDEEEEISGDGGEEDAEDEDEDEEDDDEEMGDDEVHDLSHPHVDRDVHELGDDYEDDVFEEEEDEDEENNFILEDGINVFDHFEVLGRADTDFPSDPFHAMPIEEVFGMNRRQGRTTSIYNLLGRADDRRTIFLHPLLNGPSVPSRSIPHQATAARLAGERDLESTSAASHLDSIFRSLRSGRPGNRLSSWADDSQQYGGANGAAVALAIEEQFIARLQRILPVEDRPSDQTHTVTLSQEKGRASVPQDAEDGARMAATIQNQGSGTQRVDEHVQLHREGTNSGNTGVATTEPLQQVYVAQGNQTAVASQHDIDLHDERNEQVIRDVEAVSQDSNSSGATLGESLRSLEVEIGSADGHDDTGERPPLPDSQTARAQALGRAVGATGNLRQIDTSGNMEGVHVGSNDRERAHGNAQEVVREMNPTEPVGASIEQQQNNLGAESSPIDPAFLEALPEELRTEVLASQENHVTQTVTDHLPTAEDIDPEFLAALPPDIQAEVLAQQRAHRLLQSPQFEGQPVEMDSASIIATFPPELRAEVLLTSSEAVLASLPSSLVSEAHMLRQRFRQNPGNSLLGALRRNRRNSGLGPRNVSLGSDRVVGNVGCRKIAFGDNIIEADGKPLVDIGSLKAMLRLLCLIQPLYKGPLQQLLLNLCAHSVTRATLIQLLLDMLMPDVGGPRSVSSSHDISSYRLYGCQSHVLYSRPQFSDGIPPLASRRVLETLTYLAQNHPFVAKILLEPHQPLREGLYMVRGKAVMVEEKQTETVKEEHNGDFPIVLLLKLLHCPLYSRSIAHLEKLMGLLKVVVNSAEINSGSGAKSQLSDTGPEAAIQENVHHAPLGTSGLEMTTQKSSGTETKVDAQSVLLNIPKRELRILSSLLACEGLSEVAYSHVAEVMMKLVKVAPPLQLLFISELVNAAQRLSKIAIGELQCLGEAETIFLSPSMSGAAILRVLQALNSLDALFDKEKDDEILPDSENDEGFTGVWDLNASLESLWQELSFCISKIENRSSSMSIASGPNGIMAPLPPGTQKVLPYIEAFFVTCDKLQSNQAAPGQLEFNSATASEVKEAASFSDSSLLSRSLKAQRRKFEKGITLIKFSERHKRLLNAFVRQNPGLLEKSLSLLLKVPRLIEFDNKRAYFRSKIRQQHHNSQNYNSIRISVRRAYILEDSYNQLRMRAARDLKGRLTVHFQGEEGIDAGGLTREWYQLLSRVIFDKGALLFTTVGNESTFQPNPNSVYQTEHLSYFKFVGRVVAKALFDGQLLDVHFTRSFYKHILGVKVTYHDIEAVDPDYYKNLKWMLENDIRDMPDLTFSMDADEEKLILYERAEVTDHELIPGGRNIRVTEENKHEYVDLVAEHQLTTAIRPQINAFLEGFSELVPRNLISIFNDKELELLISGLPEIDLDDLRANTEYAGYSAASPVIQWFWEVLQSFSKEDKARLLQFVTGTSKVPLEGFRALQGISGLQRFQIHKAYGSPDRLPSAHTCFNQLDLPEYPSKEQLQERLFLAIHEASEGFGFG